LKASSFFTMAEIFSGMKTPHTQLQVPRSKPSSSQQSSRDPRHLETPSRLSKHADEQKLALDANEERKTPEEQSANVPSTPTASAPAISNMKRAEAHMNEAVPSGAMSSSRLLDPAHAAAKVKELKDKIHTLRSQGLESQAEKVVKELFILEKRILVANKRRQEQQEKTQVVETFELKARLCERKRSLETRIATLTHLGMVTQVEILRVQLKEVDDKLRG